MKMKKDLTNVLRIISLIKYQNLCFEREINKYFQYNKNNIQHEEVRNV